MLAKGTLPGGQSASGMGPSAMLASGIEASGDEKASRGTSAESSLASLVAVGFAAPKAQPISRASTIASERTRTKILATRIPDPRLGSMLAYPAKGENCEGICDGCHRLYRVSGGKGVASGGLRRLGP